MLKKAIAVVVVCTFITIMTAGCVSHTGSGPSPSPSASPSTHALSKAQARATSSSQLGQATKGDLVFTAQTVGVPQQIGNASPAGGYSTKFIGCNVTITNNGTTEQTFYTIASSLADQLGVSRSVTITPQADAPITMLPQKMTIVPKQSVQGIIVFEIPSSGAYTWSTLKYDYGSQEGSGSNEVDIPLK